MGRNLAVLSCLSALVALCVLSSAHATTVSLQPAPNMGENVQVRFDPHFGQTHIEGRVASGLCYSFALLQEWRSTFAGADMHLDAASSEAELKVRLRSAHELQELPLPDLARRDAALLQQDYEALLGRPAQSASLVAISPGAARWSATWADPSLPSGPMTVEAFIVPLSEGWVLELSFAGVTTKEEHAFLANDLLKGLKVRRGPACGELAAF